MGPSCQSQRGREAELGWAERKANWPARLRSKLDHKAERNSNWEKKQNRVNLQMGFPKIQQTIFEFNRNLNSTLK